MRQVKIGIPKSFLYYRYYNIWKIFFNELGVEVITSDITLDTKNMGDQLVDSDGCRHLRDFIGSVVELKESCDYILIPEIINLIKGDRICPIISGLKEITESLVSDIEILSYKIDKNHKKDELSGYIQMGQRLGFSYNKIIKAYKEAIYEDEKIHINMNLNIKDKLSNGNRNIIVAGNFYTFNDELKKIFYNDEFNIIYSDYINSRYDDIELNLTKSVKDTYIKEFIKAIELNIDKIDGIILIEEENCFMNSVVENLLIYKLVNKPVITVNAFDNQVGDKIKLFYNKVRSYDETSY